MPRPGRTTLPRRWRLRGWITPTAWRSSPAGSRRRPARRWPTCGRTPWPTCWGRSCPGIRPGGCWRSARSWARPATRSIPPWPTPSAPTAASVVCSSSTGPTGQGGGRGESSSHRTCPRTYIDGALLPLARDLVKRQDAAGLRVVFGSVPDTLSQLIRTAFVAAPGRTLVDADFSAIEARMIAWLAGEEWVLEVFRTHGKIYEAAAAQMFGVPIEAIKRAIRNTATAKGQGGDLGPGLPGRRRLPDQYGGPAHGHPGRGLAGHCGALALGQPGHCAVLEHGGGGGTGGSQHRPGH